MMRFTTFIYSLDVRYITRALHGFHHNFFINLSEIKILVALLNHFYFKRWPFKYF